MPDYLAVPERTRARLIHEKARARERGSLVWIRSYLSDVLDDDELARETPSIRWLLLSFLHLAARSGWVVIDDPRRLAGVLSMKPQDVKRGLDRLVEMGRLERVSGSDRLDDGAIQMRLQADQQPLPYASPEDSAQAGENERPSSDLRAVVERPSSGVRKAVDRGLGVSLNHAGSDDPAASERLAQSRAEQRRELPSSSKNVSLDAEALQLPDDRKTGEITRRTIALVARGDARSASIIRTVSAGLPEHVLARALESYLGRHPRPRNPGGYIVATIRAIAAESGLTIPTIEREPDL